ncbi:protein FAM161B [Syngnathus typhle]|uniref:protein FAM161B n=1 Tax=Syngnathus typhle TaxID=161592 RepID=UPI002A6A3B19|nr:protein FAM161B [Syngnathus typhle]
MANAHWNNVLVTSCLKRPVDPHTRVPLASYERNEETPYSATTHADNCDGYQQEQEKEDEVAGGDMRDQKAVAQSAPTGIFFSNEEYYSKLEELKKAHLRTMAELESMYHHKLQLHALAAPNTQQPGPGAFQHLRKSHSAVELRRASGASSTSDDASGSDVEKGLLFCPKEFIQNMWTDFKLSPRTRQLSASLPGERDGFRLRRRLPGVTVPRPFQMTLREAERRQREAERRRRGVKTRAEVELENARLRRELEEMAECRNKFRASPVPAHVHLPLYQELQERRREPRRSMPDNRHLKTKPFSFLERERLKKEQQQQQQQPPPGQPERPKPFKAKPVPKSVSGDQRKEEQLYRSIKKQMRAQEMLRSSSAPPSTLSKRLAESKRCSEQAPTFSHRPLVNKDVPDFDVTFKRFRKRMEQTKEVKPTTACEPFQLRTARIPSQRQPKEEKECGGLTAPRWPRVRRSGTPDSSLCSSLSGSVELLPAKDTDATKKRHQAVRQALERRRRAEQEEARWTERQKEREKTLQKLVQKRASAIDPHLALTHTHGNKLQEFRKQDRQRRREYQQEIKEMEERVKSRPLLLEQVAQKNAKQAAQKRFADTLHRVHLSEEFLNRKVAAVAARTGADATREPSESEDGALLPVHYRKIFLDNQDQEESDKASPDGSEDAGHYSDDDHHQRDPEEAEDEKQDDDDHQRDAEEAEDEKHDDEELD